MEKNQNDDMLTEGYYITLNGKIINNVKEPFSLKEAYTIFNTIKDIMLKEDENAYIGFNTIVSKKSVVEIVDSEFLEVVIKDKSIPTHYRPISNPPSPICPPAMPYAPYNGPSNPFMDPSIMYSPVPFYCSSEKPKTEKEKQFFDKVKDELFSAKTNNQKKKD